MRMEEKYEEEDMPKEVIKLLAEFLEVFDKPKRLPPSRGFEHRIQLIQGEKPFKIRSYRYSHFQKAEIEKLVHEMLNDRII